MFTVSPDIYISFFNIIFIQKPTGFKWSLSTNQILFFFFFFSAAPCLHICILTSISLPRRPSWILNTEFQMLLMQMCWRALWSCYYIVNGAKYMPAGAALQNLLLENSVMLNLGSVPSSVLFPISQRRQRVSKPTAQNLICQRLI